jgi:hypothetical protein
MNNSYSQCATNFIGVSQFGRRYDWISIHRTHIWKTLYLPHNNPFFFKGRGVFNGSFFFSFTSSNSMHLFSVVQKKGYSCKNNDSCTSPLQQMYNTPSYGVGLTHCRIHPMWRNVVHLLYTWCTGITSPSVISQYS